MDRAVRKSAYLSSCCCSTAASSVRVARAEVAAASCRLNRKQRKIERARNLARWTGNTKTRHCGPQEWDPLPKA